MWRGGCAKRADDRASGETCVGGAIFALRHPGESCDSRTAVIRAHVQTSIRRLRPTDRALAVAAHPRDVRRAARHCARLSRDRSQPRRICRRSGAFRARRRSRRQRDFAAQAGCAVAVRRSQRAREALRQREHADSRRRALARRQHRRRRPSARSARDARVRTARTALSPDRRRRRRARRRVRARRCRRRAARHCEPYAGERNRARASDRLDKC